MPSILLKVPTLVQPLKNGKQKEFWVRPLFFEAPGVSHRRQAEALLRFRMALRQFFSGYEFSRKSADRLLWFMFSPKLKLRQEYLEINTGSNFVKGDFSYVTFDWRGNTYVLLPAFSNFMFIVPKTEKGKPDFSGIQDTVLKLLRQFKKTEGDNFSPERFFSVKGEFLTTVEEEFAYKDGIFGFEKNDWMGIFSFFRVETIFDGLEELDKVGHDLCYQYPAHLSRAHFVETQVTLLNEQLFSPKNTPLVLVGKTGTGRHTLMEEVVWRYMDNDGEQRPHNKRQGFYLLNPNRVIAGMSIVGHWERRFEAILQYASKPGGREQYPIKLLIDNPVALLHIGKTSQSDLNLAKVLKPFLEKRLLQVTLIATPEEWKIVQEKDRSFSDLFSMMRVQEPDTSTAIKMSLERRRVLEREHNCIISIPALSQLFTLHRNFLKNKALPGGVILLMEQLAAKFRNQKADAEEVRAEFKALSGLQERIFDEQTRLDDDDLREMVEHELVGQPAAVEALLSAVHLIKAKLTDRQKPLGSFLFIGPTGVGKTHAAKLLCKCLLGDADQLLRFDMNEYIDGGALHRLIGDFNNPEGQLTGKVRYRPFGVVLLDEIEKAHPSIHDLLLQMLDDARLTDSLGRTVDFSNTIIIMTSNLGSRAAGNQLGFNKEKADLSEVYRREVEKFFRPELVNRIEKTVVFNPLQASEVQKIARLQIRELLQRDGFVRRTTIVNVTPEALSWVAGRGFDPLMGGRALKRQIERDLTLLSAEQLLKTAAETPIIFTISLENDRLIPEITPLEFVLPLDDSLLPALPGADEMGRYFQQLIREIESIERQISTQERSQQKGNQLFNVGKDSTSFDSSYYLFKEKVAKTKEAVQLKMLRQKDRRQSLLPAIPFRLRQGSIIPRRGNVQQAYREKLRDKLFQLEALTELRENYRHGTPDFDSMQTDYLVSFFDLAFLKTELGGFLGGEMERVVFRFESCVTTAGEEEMMWLSDLYIKVMEKMDVEYKLTKSNNEFEAQGYHLSRLFGGEEGIHLFYIAHEVPLPIRLRFEKNGVLTPRNAASQVVRIYDGMETMTDLRSGFSNVANITADEFKLLLFAGQ